MNRVLSHCIEVFLVVYMDDLVEFRKPKEHNVQHIEKFLSRMKKERIILRSNEEVLVNGTGFFLL